jgi:hypothetical protein
MTPEHLGTDCAPLERALLRDAVDAIARALALLAASPKAHRCYVLIEDEITQRFVQAFGSIEDGITIDLPLHGAQGIEPSGYAIALRLLPDEGTLLGYRIRRRRVASPIEGARVATEVLKHVLRLPAEAEIAVTFESSTRVDRYD